MGADDLRVRDADFPLASRPGYLIRVVHQLLVAAFNARTAAAGLTPVQYATLNAIGWRPGVDQVGVGRMVACDKATIGSVLDRLEQKGLVLRLVDPQDRRARRLQLTGEGERLLTELSPAVDAAHHEVLAPLAPHEVDTLVALLARIAGRA